MKQDYLIAEHRIRVENEALLHAIDKMSGFEVFKVDNKDENAFCFTVMDSKTPDWEKVLYSIDINGTVSRFGSCADGYLFDSTPQYRKTLKLWVDKTDVQPVYQVISSLVCCVLPVGQLME